MSNVSYTDMPGAGEQAAEGDRSMLKRVIDGLIAGGYVTDVTRRPSEAS